MSARKRLAGAFTTLLLLGAGATFLTGPSQAAGAPSAAELQEDVGHTEAWCHGAKFVNTSGMSLTVDYFDVVPGVSTVQLGTFEVGNGQTHTVTAPGEYVAFNTLVPGEEIPRNWRTYVPQCELTAAPKGGTVMVGQEFEVSWESSGLAHVRADDWGPGMPTETLPADGSATAVATGVGDAYYYTVLGYDQYGQNVAVDQAFVEVVRPDVVEASSQCGNVTFTNLLSAEATVEFGAGETKLGEVVVPVGESRTVEASADHMVFRAISFPEDFWDDGAQETGVVDVVADCPEEPAPEDPGGPAPEDPPATPDPVTPEEAAASPNERDGATGEVAAHPTVAPAAGR